MSVPSSINGPVSVPPPSYPAEAEFMTEPEAAKFVGVPEGRLRKWRRGGLVAYSKPTMKTVVYFKPDLIALLRATRVEATAPPPRPSNAPKSPEHRAAIAAGQARAWERRRAANATGSKGRPS